MWSIAKDDRVFIAGQTGGGKTYAVRLLTLGLRRFIVVDPKGIDPRNGLSIRKWHLQPWSNRGMRELEKGDAARLHYVPDPRGEDWDAFYHRIFELGDVAIYVDELHMALPKWRGEQYTGLHEIYQQGRGAGIQAWGGTQYPSYIPPFVYDQSQVFFCFRILNENHRAKMADMMGRVVNTGDHQEIWPDPHGFWRYRVGDLQPEYFSGIELEKTRETRGQGATSKES